MMTSSLSRAGTTCFVVPLALVLVLVLLLVAATATDAQHLLRNLDALAVDMIVLRPIPNVEILPIAAPIISAPAVFTIERSALVAAVTFFFDSRLAQVPFACGGGGGGGSASAPPPRAYCRATSCYVTCGANSTYSIALRCNSSSVTASNAGWRTVAMSEDDVHLLDDHESISLRVNQRMAAGTTCHFAFANDLLGRPFAAGRLRGWVQLTVARTLPFGSGLAFHPYPGTWNNSRSSLLPLAASRPSGAYARCTATGDITYVADPNSTATTDAASNWTAACCYDSAAAAGSCTVAYSRVPAFFDATGSRKIIWALVGAASSVSSSRAADAACAASTTDAAPAPAAIRALRLNATALFAPGAADFVIASSPFAFAPMWRSLLTLIQMPTAPATAPLNAAAVGVFFCLVDTPGANATAERVCVLFAGNASVRIAPLGASVESGTLTPLCEAAPPPPSSPATTAAANRAAVVSPLGPIDDATAPSSTESHLPRGPCVHVTDRALCGAPCVWSTVWAVCMWGDTWSLPLQDSRAAAAASGGSSGPAAAGSPPLQLATSAEQVLRQSAACEWPSPNVSAGAAPGAGYDLRCRVAASGLPLAALLARLCLLRGFPTADVSWCISSAFTCAESPEVVVDRLMTLYCLQGAAPACADPSISCAPSGVTPAPPPAAAIVLSVVANRSSISVASEIRVARGGFVSVGIFLVAIGAQFNLTSIRNALAAGVGFVPVVPPGSSDFGRFSVATEMASLFPDPIFAVTDIAGSQLANVTAAASLVIRFAATPSLQPLPGTEQYIDIVPASDRASLAAQPWMQPAIFTFERVRVTFVEAAAEPCSHAGLATAAVIFGLLSGLGGWMNVVAVQVTLVGAQSTCAPEPVRRCYASSVGLVSPARWIWPASSEDLERAVFWSQFLPIAVALLLHLVLLRLYQHIAPLRGSAEQTLWFPAPVFYLAGLLAVGTVQSAWVVIFNDVNAALRVVSFFGFALLVGTVLPWTFLKIFRDDENYFHRYDFSRLIRQTLDPDSHAAAAAAAAGGAGSKEGSPAKLLQEPLLAVPTTSPTRSARRDKKSKATAQQQPQDKKPASSSTMTGGTAPPLPALAPTACIAQRANVSMHNNLAIERRTRDANAKWSSTGERVVALLFDLLMPVGSWPQTRGMAPLRDLMVPSAGYFPCVTLLAAGLIGLNFSYVGVGAAFCRANYVNMAVLQGLWIACTIGWRPFRVRILTALWLMSRLLDFAAAVMSSDWVAAKLPDPDTARAITRLYTASLVFTLIFSVVTCLVKLRELLGLMAQYSDSKLQLARDERSLNVLIGRMQAGVSTTVVDGVDAGGHRGGGGGGSGGRRGLAAHGDTAVVPIVPLRAPAVAGAAAAGAANASSSPSPTRCDARCVEVSWDDDGDHRHDGADLALAERLAAQRSQRMTNMLATLGTLQSVRELLTPRAARRRREHGDNDHGIGGDRHDDRHGDDDDDDVDDDADAMPRAPKVRLLARFADGRDAVAAVSALAGKLDQSGTVLRCRLVDNDEAESSLRRSRVADPSAHKEPAAAVRAKSPFAGLFSGTWLEL